MSRSGTQITDGRRIERIRINSEILSLQKKLDHTDSRVQNFKNSKFDQAFVKANIEKLVSSVDEYNESISTLTARLSSLENGELDGELDRIRKDNTSVVNEKNKIKMAAKLVIKEANEIKKEHSKNYYDQQRKSDRVTKDWYYASAQRHFFKAATTIPPYMSRDLKKMPCNEGFSWKNVYFFGNNKATSQTNFKITDNRKGHKVIHTWNPTIEKKFKKFNQTGKIELISSIKRVKKV